MKYIITEMQYNRAVDGFLTYMFEPHEVKTTSLYPDNEYWLKDGEVVAAISPHYFWVPSNVWQLFSKMFSLNTSEEKKRLISQWLLTHYGISDKKPMSANNIPYHED